MILAFDIADIIKVPFGYLLDILYRLTTNYGVAMILFAILVKVIMLPINAKSKKSSMAMSRLSPKIKVIQEKYANDSAKQSELIQALYKEEGVSMAGGCLWGFVPLLILLPLYAVVRQPITYMLHETLEVSEQIVKIVKDAIPALFTGNEYYEQMVAAPYISQFAESLKAAIPDIKDSTLAGLNFSFLGVDLGSVPNFNIFTWEKYDWATIGAFLIPVLSAGSQVVNMFVSQKMNNSVVTDQNGIYDEETAKKSQSNQSMKMMTWVMPLISLWIGFTIPIALSLYWFVQGVVSMVMDIFLTKHYRKIYDAEDAIRLQKAIERDREEAEKERIRAERRNANPDGITENTSKKKLQAQQQRQAQEQRAAAAKEYAAKKGIVEEVKEEKTVLSGIAERPYCKGRAYDPNRYANTEE